MDIQARRLVFHSAVVLLIGTLCGLLLEATFVLHWLRGSDLGGPELLWRLAHRGLLFGGVLGLAIAGFLSLLDVEPARKSRVAWWFILSNYAFCFSLVFGAAVGQRGLIPSPLWTGVIPPLPWTNLIVFLGNFVGTFGGLIGAILLLMAARSSLQKGVSE